MWLPAAQGDAQNFRLNPSMKIPHLKKRREFLRVANEGFKVVMPNIILQAARNLYGKRIGYTATKKLGKAHDRNRVRRRMRAAVLGNIALFPENVDMVCIGRHNTAECDFSALSQNVENGFLQIKQHFSEKKDENPSDSAC